MAPHRRRDFIASMRRVEDTDDSGALDNADAESLSEEGEGSVASDAVGEGAGPGAAGGDDDEKGSHRPAADATDATPKARHVNGHGQATPRTVVDTRSGKNAETPAKTVANGVGDVFKRRDKMQPQARSDRKEADGVVPGRAAVNATQEDLPSPAVVDSTAHMDRLTDAPHERRRREHDEYRKKRDEDPAFVPNRGAFFMHDHRHAGPAANGFRPFGRGRGRGRGGYGASFGAMHPMSEPIDAPWAHDMHEANLHEHAHAHAHAHTLRGPARAASTTTPNRSLSSTKHIGNVQIRVFLPVMSKPLTFPGIAVQQYTRLPDHRPPLRRDKPVRISLPNFSPRYIYPAIERSFIFIPRALRPNQQGFANRGRGRSNNMGSMGGISRRTSIFGGSMYGSAYSPSVAMSRRSSLAREVNRDSIISPTASIMSRPPLPAEAMRPVVKLPPPASHAHAHPALSAPQPVVPEQPSIETSAQIPALHENRPTTIPMHQPRPQKAVSVADIESPAGFSYPPPQQPQAPFHQQVPLQVHGGMFNKEDRRHDSFSSHTAGTPLSQIPERAIHAPAFQPHAYPSQGYYPGHHPLMQPPPQPGYFYPPAAYNPGIPVVASPYQGTTPSMPSFPPSAQPPQQQPQPQPAQQADSTPNSAGEVQNLIAQEANGMVYYYDAQQVANFHSYPPAATASFSMPLPLPAAVGGVVGMGGMMTPSPDGFYYPQSSAGVVYYG